MIIQNMIDTRRLLLAKGYIPLDKSWIIRMGVLDLVNGQEGIFGFLSAWQSKLSDDLLSLQKALAAWKDGQTEIDVGESGTLLRFLKFASWKLGVPKRFVLHGTLVGRTVCDDPQITNWAPSQLLALDSGTSQWASAAVLLGSPERIEFPPFKLELTYQAVEHWKSRRSIEKMWSPCSGATIMRQAAAFLQMLKCGQTNFLWHHAEDYCFFRAFGLMRKEQGESLWPSLRGHETDRIAEMESVIALLNRNSAIESRDHRAVQAVAMLAKFKGINVEFVYPKCVSKSWPQFWHFMRDVPKLCGLV